MTLIIVFLGENCTQIFLFAYLRFLSDIYNLLHVQKRQTLSPSTNHYITCQCQMWGIGFSLDVKYFVPFKTYINFQWLPQTTKHEIIIQIIDKLESKIKVINYFHATTNINEVIISQGLSQHFKDGRNAFIFCTEQESKKLF